TLRFLCKLKNQEILQPLVESIRNNLDHRHAYPRRNAVLAIYSIAKDFPNLIPDAADLIYDFLQKVLKITHQDKFIGSNYPIRKAMPRADEMRLSCYLTVQERKQLNILIKFWIKFKGLVKFYSSLL